MKVLSTTETKKKYVNFEYNSIFYNSERKTCEKTREEFSIEYWRKNCEGLEKICILKDLFEYFQHFMTIKLNQFVNLNQIKENNSCNINAIKVGTLWDGNKIGDLIFREVCYNDNTFIPVFLNYTADNPEIISYKLSVADCQILLFDVDIPKSFIYQVSNTFSTKYDKRIFLLPSDQVLFSDPVNKNLCFTNFTNSELINDSQIIYSENYLENLESNQIKTDKANEHANKSKKVQSSKINQYLSNIESIYSGNETNNKTNMGNRMGILKPEIYSKVRNIVFTSGSTGRPKGAELTFGNYSGMISTLSVLCNNNNNMTSIFVITNPLHHVNSTCFTEYCIRNSSKLILIHKYSKVYWKILNETIKISISNYGNNFNMIVPLVPKHFEYFSSMVENNYFEDRNEILTNLSHPSVSFFFGSSAVSNDLINEFKKLLNGKLPRIRFGSTETCLQLCGTDLLMDHSLLNATLRITSNVNEIHSNSKKKNGYFIGRSIQPFAEVFVVKSIDINADNFLVPTSEFEVGHIICRGETIMNGYINHENILITREIANRINKIGFSTQKYHNMLFICDNHPWYLGLGDQGYWTAGRINNNSESSTVHILGKERQVTHINKDPNIIIEEKLNSCACCKDSIFVDNIFLFWISRSSSIIKIGGVKYSSEEINDRIVTTLKNSNKKKFPKHFFSTVITNKDDKISEDDRIIFIYEPFENSENFEQFIRNELSYSNIPKSYIPYKIIETEIPRTFKGSIDREKLLEKIEL
ncbi:AMP-binding enzyme family protein [Cryptosporidium meleagridis]|uniref:AMP-binding enzyme family protein n=1 Tax=Cryptosporidium meleagridis TaxID=93969 RepID=A0A2P4Z2L1_9CRYT|nr:AMP-binding enzyme family protein [Cryptosporidium meleagridis]